MQKSAKQKIRYLLPYVLMSTILLTSVWISISSNITTDTMPSPNNTPTSIAPPLPSNPHPSSLATPTALPTSKPQLSTPSPKPELTPAPIPAPPSAFQYRFPFSDSISSVDVVGVGVYWDPNCTNSASSIVWGTIYPGETKTVNLFIQNELNVPVTLFYSGSNYNPDSLVGYLSLSWSYNGQVLEAGTVLPVQVSLKADIDIIQAEITDFSFDIFIGVNNSGYNGIN